MGTRLDLRGTWTRSVGGRDIDFVKVPGVYLPTGECELRYEFTLPWPDAAGRMFLVTEGVLARARFELNGQPIGEAGPWSTYRFEIPADLMGERNLLVARVSDIVEDFGPTPGRRFDAGLVRDIFLELRPNAYIESFSFRYALADDFSSADCHVRIEIDGVSADRPELVFTERGNGRVVARASADADGLAEFTVDWPHLWSPSTPNLYTLTVSLGEDKAFEKVGLRHIETRGSDFFLNGQRIVLKGICRHEFTTSAGYSPSEEEVRRDLALIKHSGFNYIRLVHSPHSGSVCRTAAELGLFVSEEPGTCFHDLGDPAIAAPAVECLKRTVKRDRNVPSILAWLIYNECNPNAEYATSAAKICRDLDPGCLLSFADCSGQDDNIKTMVRAADLSFYGINVYSFSPNAYCEKMKIFNDKPLVFTEWGGWIGPGNPRILTDLCDGFAIHSRESQELRVAGCSYWIWADYEERSRPKPAAIEGWTIEGLVDKMGQPKPDLQTLSLMCYKIDNPPPSRQPVVEVISQGPRRREIWLPVALDDITENQRVLAELVDKHRRERKEYQPDFLAVTQKTPLPPHFGRLLVDGIEIECRDAAAPRHPLYLARQCPEIEIPFEGEVDAVAVLGNVAIVGGYPPSSVWSVHHRDSEPPVEFASPAAEYEFSFDDGSVVVPLRHGLEVLRANDISRWWTTGPRAPYTKPAVRCVVNESYETLRVDLWEHEFGRSARLRSIRWRLIDESAVLALYGLSLRQG